MGGRTVVVRLRVCFVEVGPTVWFAYRHRLHALHMLGKFAPPDRVASEQLPQVINGKGWLAQRRPIPGFVEAAVDTDPLQEGFPEPR